MKKITGDEDFINPILLLFFYSMLIVGNTSELRENLEAHGSIILDEPILFTDNVFETLTRFCWFFIPAVILVMAIRERDPFLRLTYFLGSVPLVLTGPIINELGLKSLYVVKVLIILAVIMCLIRYLIYTTELYKKVLKQKQEKDNNVGAQDGSTEDQ